jgi:hypothetical protein
LCIRCSVLVAGGERLQILPARGFAFIQHHHLGARFGSSNGGAGTSMYGSVEFSVNF